MKNIGIVGFGYVGQAVYNSLKTQELNIYIFDPDKGYENILNMDSCIMPNDALFICVPTPQLESGESNILIIDEILNHLSIISYNGLVIIKSTVESKYFEEEYQDLNIVYQPEFLNELTYLEDFKNQTSIVMGGKLIDTKKAQLLYRDIFEFNNEVKYNLVSAKVAMDFKYARNIKNALNVIYWNMVEDIFRNQDQIALLMRDMPTNELDNIHHKGYRGYGGSCLPKDTKHIDNQYNNILIKAIVDYNKTL